MRSWYICVQRDRGTRKSEPMPPALTIHYGSATYTPNPARATTIGRAPDCDLVIHNPYVSHHHARVTFTDDGWLLEDMGSANGLSINGIHTTSVLLLNSTKVTLAQGATIVCIVGTNGPATPAQPPPEAPCSKRGPACTTAGAIGTTGTTHATRTATGTPSSATHATRTATGTTDTTATNASPAGPAPRIPGPRAPATATPPNSSGTNGSIASAGITRITISVSLRISLPIECRRHCSGRQHAGDKARVPTHHQPRARVL